MSVILDQVQKAIRRTGGVDMGALRDRVRALTPRQIADAGSLAQRRDFLRRTAGDDRAGEMAFERIINGNELQDVNYLVRGARAGRSIGRVVIRDSAGRRLGYGTGFLVGPGVLLTNHHVLEGESMAERSEVEFEYERDEDGRELAPVRFALEPGRVFFSSEALDFSVVGVAAAAANAERRLDEFGFLPLVAGMGKVVEGEWLTIIQHPAGGLKQVCVRENRLLQKTTDVLWYSSDTLGGSSGSPVFNNDWMVVALHHSGIPEMRNGRTQTVDGQDFDPRLHREEDIKWIANEGIRVSRIVETLRADAGGNPSLRTVLDATPEMALAATRSVLPTVSTVRSFLTPQPEPTPMSNPAPAIGNRTVTVTLNFDANGNVSLGPVSRPLESAPALEAGAVKKAKPQASGVAFEFDENYDTRNGYDPDFLGKGAHRVPLPKMSDGLAHSATRLLKPKAGNDHVLHYTNMSLVMHARRRFAIFSAANVDFAGRFANLKSKRVWRFDPRIPADAQVGDEAYVGNQFDRGHLTRQEDMEFGATIPEALQSTADTCHWTNCTLQHQQFNRTEDWWQGLEQHILERSISPLSKGFRAQVFTGPIFSELDPVFPELPGIQVPMIFWKVAVAVTSAGRLFAVAYLMDQRPVIKKYGLKEAAGATPFAPYKLFQLPLAELEAMTQLKFTCGPDGVASLRDYDPLKHGAPKLDADQDGNDDRHESTVEEATPSGWIDLNVNPPHLGS